MSRPLALRLTFAALLAGSALVASPNEAHAQRSYAGREVLSTMGHKGTLAIDQLSGFRMSTLGGVDYAGPIGVSFQSRGENVPNANATAHYTNFWLAPSADYFIIDHLSLGGILEIVSTGESITTTTTIGSQTTTTDTTLPSTTSVTFIPRIGYLFAITERFGIWPRGGIGYGSQQVLNGTGTNAPKDTLSGFLFDVDCGFLYRVNENFFLRAAPAFTVGLGPSHSTTVTGGGNTTTVSNDASLFQFALTGGIGVMWDL